MREGISGVGTGVVVEGILTPLLAIGLRSCTVTLCAGLIFRFRAVLVW